MTHENIIVDFSLSGIYNLQTLSQGSLSLNPANEVEGKKGKRKLNKKENKTLQETPFWRLYSPLLKNNPLESCLAAFQKNRD